MRRAVLVFFGATAVACGGSSAKVSVSLVTSSSTLFDPYRADSSLAKVRVTVDGDAEHDDASLDLADTHLADRSVVFDELPTGHVATVTARGFDGLGNLVAFGELRGVSIEGDVAVSLAFRPNLAFVTHLPNDHQKSPASWLYVLDIATRTYATKLKLPGTDPIGRGVTSRGGDAVVVTYDDQGSGFVGVLSAADGTWASIPIGHTADLALTAPGSKLGVAAGGGGLSIIDLEQKTALQKFDVGGAALDGAISADGKTAILALDATPAILLVDLTSQCTAAFLPARCLHALDILPGAAGIALAPDGHTAFITSSQRRTVMAFDLDNQHATVLDGGFAVPVGAAAFAAESQTLLALQAGATGAPHVLPYNVPGRAGGSLADAPGMLLVPKDIAADPSGRRVVAVAAGTSSVTAGLTVVETLVDPNGSVRVVGSTRVYPNDPDDTFMERHDFVAHQRYQPAHVGILYGR